MTVRVAILVGGRARRMGGAAKGLIEVDGEPNVLRLARALGWLGPVTLIGDPTGPYGALGLPIVADAVPDGGATVGLATALASGPPGWVFVCALDLPRLDAETARWLADARQPGDRAVLARAGGHVQPLAGLWHTDVRATMRPDRALKGLAEDVGARILDAPDPAAFANLNTPADVAALRASGRA